MNFVSTRHLSSPTTFEDALIHGLATDGGLYIPSEFPLLTNEFFETLTQQSLQQIGTTQMLGFLPEIPSLDMQKIVDKALNFPIPLIKLEDNLFLLEVFQGPTLSFKDVGARFMAQTLGYYLAKKKRNITILVATSGDTGSAIAQAFHAIPFVEVFILYPSQKITYLQEKQITTVGGNIHTLEVEGTFDDCQKLVKQALLDNEIREKRLLTTANSINISRLLPQIIYHSWGMAQLKLYSNENPTLVVPSGNFGNLTAAIYAKRIGFSVNHFVAATNINTTLPDYLHTGEFKPRPSKQSISNAMDVGNPSNFERLNNLYANHTEMRRDIEGISISDEKTLATIRETYDTAGYILDPHTAVGVAAAKESQYGKNGPIIVTATAHPAKFPEAIKRATGIEIELTESLQKAYRLPKQSIKMQADYLEFKKHLLAL
jgi:threonine synthase